MTQEIDFNKNVVYGDRLYNFNDFKEQTGDEIDYDQLISLYNLDNAQDIFECCMEMRPELVDFSKLKSECIQERYDQWVFSGENKQNPQLSFTEYANLASLTFLSKNSPTSTSGG